MNEHTNKKVLQVLSRIVLIFLFITLMSYCFVGQMLHTNESTFSTQTTDFNSSWSLVAADGATQPIDVPGKVAGVNAGETVTIKTTLPPDITSETFLMLWDKGQFVKAYIDGNLIYDYDFDDLDNIGKQLPYSYLFIPLDSTYAGHTLTLEFEALLKTDAGYVGTMAIGDKTSLVLSVIKPCQFELVFAFVLITFGLLIIIGGLFIHRRTKMPEPLGFLGLAVILAAFWILANSSARQFVFHNVSIIRDSAFLAVALMPVPFMAYLDRLQQRRYHKAFAAICAISSVNFCLLFVLNILQFNALSEMFIVSPIMVLVAVVVTICTMVLDVRNKQNGSYRIASIGMALFSFFSVAQVVEYIVRPVTFTATFLVIGLFFLAAFSVANAVSDMANTQIERAHAVAKVQSISEEAMESLAKTVDAKDRYTSGHSQRVADYSCRLARLMGFNDDQLHDLYYVALLHDVGKIGIPDEIINKPGKLTDEEYATIKSHTVIGGEILETFTNLPGLDIGARWHHERYDGTGYPDGLAGEEIPLICRIIGVADSYDAMSSCRSYRDALPQEVVRAEVEKGKGTQFDPAIADLMLQLIDADTHYDMCERRS